MRLSCPVEKALISRPKEQGSSGFMGSPAEAPRCTLMAPGASKIRHGCNVLHVSIQVIALWVPNRNGSKLRWLVSGSFLVMNPRPSAIAHCEALVRCYKSLPNYLNILIKPEYNICWSIFSKFEETYIYVSVKLNMKFHASSCTNSRPTLAIHLSQTHTEVYQEGQIIFNLF